MLREGKKMVSCRMTAKQVANLDYVVESHRKERQNSWGAQPNRSTAILLLIEREVLRLEAIETEKLQAESKPVKTKVVRKKGKVKP